MHRRSRRPFEFFKKNVSKLQLSKTGSNMPRTPEQRVVSIVNHLDQAATELDYLYRETSRSMVRDLQHKVEVAQQIAGRDLTREFSLPSYRFASSGRVASRFLEAHAGRELLNRVIDEREFVLLLREVEKQDEQAAELLREVRMALAEAMKISDNEYNALSRVQQLVVARGRWDIGLQRNNIFKAADLLGIKLPSWNF